MGAVSFGSTARCVERNSDSITLVDESDAGSYCSNQRDGLVTGDERKLRLDRPVSIGRMDICAVHSTGFRFHADLAWPGLGKYLAPA